MSIYELLKKPWQEWSIELIEQVSEEEGDGDKAYAMGMRHALERVLLLHMPKTTYAHADHLIQTAGAESLYSENDMERGREAMEVIKQGIKD